MISLQLEEGLNKLRRSVWGLQELMWEAHMPSHACLSINNESVYKIWGQPGMTQEKY